jgi:hypothetical protein
VLWHTSNFHDFRLPALALAAAHRAANCASA